MRVVVLRLLRGVLVAEQFRPGCGLWRIYRLGCMMRGRDDGNYLIIVGCCNCCVNQELWVINYFSISCVTNTLVAWGVEGFPVVCCNVRMLDGRGCGCS